MKKFFLALIVLFQPLAAHNIGLLVMATGKYIQFVPQLVESANLYFCTNHNVTYFIFTDGTLEEEIPNVVTIYQKRLGWPFDTMMRFHAYAGQHELLSQQDYLYACDADMRFVGEVGDEILGKRVATIHPGFVNKRGSYETKPKSKACVYDNEGEYYFAGGFYGGTSSEFLRIVRTNARHVDIDLKHDIIAVWHDESHWNRYCIDFPPTIILSPSYCYPEDWDLPYPKKLLALNKNHAEMRSDK